MFSPDIETCSIGFPVIGNKICLLCAPLQHLSLFLFFTFCLLLFCCSLLSVYLNTKRFCSLLSVYLIAFGHYFLFIWLFLFITFFLSEHGNVWFCSLLLFFWARKVFVHFFSLFDCVCSLLSVYLIVFVHFFLFIWARKCLVLLHSWFGIGPDQQLQSGKLFPCISFQNCQSLSKEIIVYLPIACENGKILRRVYITLNSVYFFHLTTMCCTSRHVSKGLAYNSPIVKNTIFPKMK